MSAKSLHANLLAIAIQVLVCAAIGLMCSLPALGSSQERGRALYENQCQSCHEEWAHSRTNRKAKSYADLHRAAAAWSTHGGLDWNTEEIDDVVEYLNAQFYHFK